MTSYLKKTLDLEEHAPYPCVLKSKDNSCIVMIHVDDLLVAGKKSFVLGRFATELRKVYDISMQCMEKPGDEIAFLKRLPPHDNSDSLEAHQSVVLTAWDEPETPEQKDTCTFRH